MALFSLNNVAIKGIAASVPNEVQSNSDLALIPEKDRDLLIRTTGIKYRRVAKFGTCASDLCLAAAEKLMASLQWEKESIQALVFVTQTPDYITPASAIVLQQRLGLSKSCLAFDINLGCSGYVYGLAMAASIIAAMPNGRALLLVGDVSSACISHSDKSVVPIFSDAGSATALQHDSSATAMTFNLESDGSGYDAIIIPAGGYRAPVSAEALQYMELEPGIARNQMHLVLNGIDVFNFSVREAPQNVQALLQHLGLKTSDVDSFVFHQANKLINDTIARKLQLAPHQAPQSLREFGNTSSATIPITIVSQLAQQLINAPAKLVFCGFGVGLSWGSVYLETKGMEILPLIEVA
ncbi:MAG: ketoacyl-ACP synthase III [Chitinophagales bacterium]|nr:ketoacyl-ACP synthase III [Chitinophagales bacterium]